MSAPDIEFDPRLLRWLLAVSDAINEVGAFLPLPYGEFSFGDIEILFDNEETSFVVGPSEHDGSFVIRYKNGK